VVAPLKFPFVAGLASTSPTNMSIPRAISGIFKLSSTHAIIQVLDAA
jgi:hypothetical protein